MEFTEELKKRTAKCNRIIKKYLPKEEEQIKTVTGAMNYCVNAGGKRLRPVIMKAAKVIMLLLSLYYSCAMPILTGMPNPLNMSAKSVSPHFFKSMDSIPSSTQNPSSMLYL